MNPQVGIVMGSDSDLPFRGLRVLDLGTFWAGPYMGMYLASLGADSVLGGVYASGPDLVREAGGYRIQPAIRERLDTAADELANRVRPSAPQPPLLRRADSSPRPTVFASAAGTWPRTAAG